MAKQNNFNRHAFEKIYTKADIELIAKVDNATERLAAPATIKIFNDEFNIFKKTDFERLKNISPAHFYRLRQTPRYRERAKTFSKTKPTATAIGERIKPEPNGKPGYLNVDTVHQGDKDGEKGVYHINIVDSITQFEFVGCVEAISELFMDEILTQLLSKFPFTIFEFSILFHYTGTLYTC
ncbi:MAG: integrase, partial [Candidatus Kerfeldbacteria bacterium]|nr:integrase [Candidatus Kerfeldbacteria bacterium]